jgi:hypothetical protein
MRVLLVLIALLVPMKARADVVVLEEFVGEVCKCDAWPTEAVSTDTTTLTDFGNPLGAYYVGFPADFKIWSNGTESLTINNHTVTYTPSSSIFATFGVDNLVDTFIVWHNDLPNLLGILETAVICDVVDSVPGVPEPSTWALMLLGFVGLGFAFRRRDAKLRSPEQRAI